jgi:hypothetical protein
VHSISLEERAICYDLNKDTAQQWKRKLTRPCSNWNESHRIPAPIMTSKGTRPIANANYPPHGSVSGLDSPSTPTPSPTRPLTQAFQNPLSRLLRMIGQHPIQPHHITLLDLPKAILAYPLCILFVLPAGMVGSDVDSRVVLVPSGHVGVCFGADGAERARDEVKDGADFGLTFCVRGASVSCILGV